MTAWHLITGEYPPTQGGVSDYSHAVAAGLAAAGDQVHVWCPGAPGDAVDVPGVEVHPLGGSWSRLDLDRIDASMNQTPGQRRLLVQWVPHAYGRRSLNVAFCRWVRRRARTGDILDLMVHEPFLSFREGSLRQDAAAVVHRVMIALLLNQARRVWVAIPAWADRLRPWAFGRDIEFSWLPIPSTIPVADSSDTVARLRAQALSRPDGVILGHFSTYPPETRGSLRVVVPQLLATIPELQIQLLGRGSEAAAAELRRGLGAEGARVHGWGALSVSALSHHLQVCDLMMQLYPDGASTRRTTLMAALAHGLPVVTTVGRLSESFWEASGAVATVPATDLSAVVRRVSALVHQPQARDRFASAARALYDTGFSMPHVISALRATACGAH